MSNDAWRAVLKRTIDLVVAGAALVLLAPVYLVIALAVVLETRGPVFYRAERVGFRGRRLRMLKFRKMDVAARGPGLTLADDARLTAVGRWLARTKLDELPQLWHVLRGEMSLVGPRPESPGFVARFPDEYAAILRIRPGLTGYTQLAFAREGAILDPSDPQRHYVNALLPQKVALDRLYASRLGTRRDLGILLATLATLVVRVPVAVDRTSGRLSVRRRPAARSAPAPGVATAAAPDAVPAPPVPVTGPTCEAPSEPS
ncbi:MAG: sugar transferase [Solirubrobacteraceae bacterium]